MLGGVVNNNSNKETTMTSKSQQATATKIRLKRVAIIGAALVYRDHPGHGPNGAPQGALPTILAKSVTVANFTSRGTYNCASCGKLTRDTGEGEYDAKMCRACFDRETWALGHDDHSEDNRPNDCPFCE